MAIEVKIPALGESISSGILSSWKVTEGSYVEIDQPIYELETDKITQEGLAETAGVISFLAQEGDEVEIGATIASIDEAATKPTGDSSSETKPSEPAEESSEATPPEEKKDPPKEKEVAPPPSVLAEATPADPTIPHSPAVRKVLAETGIDPSTTFSVQ